MKIQVVGFALAALFALSLGGCVEAPPAGEQQVEDAAVTDDQDFPADPDEGDGTRVETLDPKELLVGRIRQDLQREHGYSTALLLRSAQEVVWPDTGFACGHGFGDGTSVAISQEIPGYQVIFEVEGQRLDFRADNKGDYMLCENVADSPWNKELPAS
ncbi:MAG: hypothetical protein AAF513_01270 [Pseudomonadota bacterium]